MINTRVMKEWALKNLERGSPLREHILRTRDELSENEAVVKVMVLLELFNEEFK